MDINSVSGEVVDSSMKVHTVLGPGLLESAYLVCLAHELHRRGIHAVTQVPLPVCYEGVAVQLGYRIDLLVDNMVLVELKAVTTLLPVHEAQLLSYLRLSGHKLGLLINFHVVHLRDGIVRMANQL